MKRIKTPNVVSTAIFNASVFKSGVVVRVVEKKKGREWDGQREHGLSL